MAGRNDHSFYGVRMHSMFRLLHVSEYTSRTFMIDLGTSNCMIFFYQLYLCNLFVDLVKLFVELMAPDI